MIMTKKNENVLMGAKRTLKTESIRTLIRLYTGEDPIINRYQEYNEIDFTDSQKKKLQDVLTGWNKSKPGDLRVKTGGILLPWSLKTYWAWIAAVFGIGFLTAYIIKK